MFIRRCAKTPSIGGCVIDVPSNEVENFELNGYAVVRGLFSGDEVAVYIDHFMRLRDADTHTNDSHSADLADESEGGVGPAVFGSKETVGRASWSRNEAFSTQPAGHLS